MIRSRGVCRDFLRLTSSSSSYATSRCTKHSNVVVIRPFAACTTQPNVNRSTACSAGHDKSRHGDHHHSRHRHRHHRPNQFSEAATLRLRHASSPERACSAPAFAQRLSLHSFTIPKLANLRSSSPSFPIRNAASLAPGQEGEGEGGAEQLVKPKRGRPRKPRSPKETAEEKEPKAKGELKPRKGRVSKQAAAEVQAAGDVEEPVAGMTQNTESVEEVTSKIQFETGKLALLADGAVMARQGDTVVTVSAVSNRNEMDDGGFLPLSVEYRQKAHATGNIPRSRDLREGQPTDAEVLTARAVDRVLRPLFPPGYCFDTQVIANVQALEEGGDPVVLAINAASAALCVSNIPWDGPAGCVRIGRANGKLVVNPSPGSFDPTAYGDGGGFDLLYAGNEHRALMIEMGGGPVQETQLSKALVLAHRHVAPLLKAQRELMAKAGKKKVFPKFDANPSEDMMEEAMRVGLKAAREVFASTERGVGGANDPSKADRGQMEGEVLREVRAALAERFSGAPTAAAAAAAEAVIKKALRMSVVEGGRRPDGRGVTELRPLKGEADVLPSVHGSGMFTRGETQTLATVSLGPPVNGNRQRYLGESKGDPEEMLTGRLHLHYDFPPYCTNETGKVGGANRRMVGHGNLAERAILSVMPDMETFPYTTRVTAEVMMSNGSSSMATVCAASLALMDAGIPLAAPVGGVSVGLMTIDAPAEGVDIGPYAILTDLQGTEDHYGDMDFKVAGTAQGVTAVQLDVKLRGGVPLSVLDEAIRAARAGRKEVLQTMKRCLPAVNPKMKPRAPRCVIVRFDPDRKRDLVGTKGQTLSAIETKFGVQVDLSAEGRAVIFSEDANQVEEAVDLVRELVHDIQEGELYNGTVTSVYEYGCLVELLRNQQGLLHVSNMSDIRPAPPARDMVEEGQKVHVRVVEVDRLRGLIKLNLENYKLTPKSRDTEADELKDKEDLQSHQ